MKIEVELNYSPKHLRVLVRDDGAGIDPEVLHSGRDGHWGLAGMRERAENIGARLKVFSQWFPWTLSATPDMSGIDVLIGLRRGILQL